MPGKVKSRVTSTKPTDACSASDTRLVALAKYHASSARAATQSSRASVRARAIPRRRQAGSTLSPVRYHPAGAVLGGACAAGANSRSGRNPGGRSRHPRRSRAGRRGRGCWRTVRSRTPGRSNLDRRRGSGGSPRRRAAPVRRHRRAWLPAPSPWPDRVAAKGRPRRSGRNHGSRRSPVLHPQVARLEPDRSRHKGFSPAAGEPSSDRRCRPRAAPGSVPSFPAWKSSNACWSSSRVFMTNGPYHATGSRIGCPRASARPSWGSGPPAR
jgi:hypothetical protein